MVQIDLQQADLDQFLQTWAQPLLREAAEKVQRKQEQLCPRDTAGNVHMAENIQIVYGAKHADIGPGASSFYARMVELGGAVNRGPKPFIRPSATP